MSSMKGYTITQFNREDTPIRTHHAESPLSDVPDSDIEEMIMSEHKILKPKEEAGKSSSGGYNLQVAMGWEDEGFVKFTVS